MGPQKRWFPGSRSRRGNHKPTPPTKAKKVADAWSGAQKKKKQKSGGAEKGWGRGNTSEFRLGTRNSKKKLKTVSGTGRSCRCHHRVEYKVASNLAKVDAAVDPSHLESNSLRSRTPVVGISDSACHQSRMISAESCQSELRAVVILQSDQDGIVSNSRKQMDHQVVRGRTPKT